MAETCPLPCFQCACKGNYCRLLGRNVNEPVYEPERCSICHHGNKLNGRIVHGPRCPLSPDISL